MNETQKEVMLICQEECAEVTQAISKCFRFGFDSEYNGRTNLQRLTEEVGDLLCMINLMIEKGVIEETPTYKALYAKRAKLEQWSEIFADKQLVN